MNHDDLLADLPAPRDDEPPSLRSDIADELLDHLQCAFRREVLKDGDEAAAEKRALARFGDPKKLARRLWRQAMWSRIMGKRILSGLQWLLTLAAVFLAGAVLWQQSAVLKEIQTARQEQRAEQQALTATLNRLFPVTASDYSPKAPPPLASYTPEDAASLTVAPVFPYVPSNPVEALLPQSLHESQDISATPTLSTSLEAPFPRSASGTLDPYRVELESLLPENLHPDPESSPVAGAVALESNSVPTLIVKLVQGSADGQPVTGLINEIVLTGAETSLPGFPHPLLVGGFDAFAARGAGTATHSETGQFHFQNLEPDRYEIKVVLADGQHCTQQVLIRDDKPKELTIVCPGPRKKVPVSITASSLPDDLRQAGIQFGVAIDAEPVILGGTRWKSVKSSIIYGVFDPITGSLIKLEQLDSSAASGETVKTDLSNVPEDERIVFVLSGPVKLRYLFDVQKTPLKRIHGMHLTLPELNQARTVEPNEDVWKLQLPEELIAEARKQLAEQKSDK